MSGYVLTSLKFLICANRSLRRFECDCRPIQKLQQLTNEAVHTNQHIKSREEFSALKEAKQKK